MSGIRAQLAMLVATAAVLPLIAYGLVSITTLGRATRESVAAGTEQLAVRAASQIEQSIAHHQRALRQAGAELQALSLLPWQRERILRSYVLAFPEFRTLTAYTPDGTVVATSRLDGKGPALPPLGRFDRLGVALAPIQIDDDLLPRTSVAVRVEGLDGPSLLVGELRLEEIWRLVDSIRVGTRGYALLVETSGRLIAHGDPDQKSRIARGEDALWHPLVRATLSRGGEAPHATEYAGPHGETLLAVGVPLPSLAWALIVEQPTEEAYALATRLERQLLVAIALALLLTIGAGYWWGRSIITPIRALMTGTEALADGQMDTRVAIARADELGRLGDAFNSMADRLVALQAEARRQERQAMFGRIAAGLVHDLAHPIQNVGNNCRLMLKMHDDPEYRETFRRTVERELSTVRRVLEDLRNLARPIPLERFPIELGRSVAEIVESMRGFADAAGVALEYDGPGHAVFIEGDVFALGRVYRNLILNGIQATSPGGVIRVTAEERDASARVTITDTGCGIPPERLAAVFEDFVTTKRRGLGLGLPISKKIVEQLDGTIAADSRVGEGTTFVIEFPTTEKRPLRPVEEPAAT